MKNSNQLWVDYFLFAAVALIWSSSFLFIKIAVREIPPETVAAGRIAIAAVVLYGYLRLIGGKLDVSLANWGKFYFIGLFGNVLPFTLIGIGEIEIDSGMAAILMGVMPVTTVLLAHLTIPDEFFTVRKGVGVMLGFGGVVVLVGPEALAGAESTTLAQLAVLGGALCYAVTTVFVRRTTSLSGPVMAAGTQIAGASLIVPIALWLHPSEPIEPGIMSIFSVVVLGLFATALATLIYFRLVKNLGASTLSQINYLIPVLGTGWGILFLSERPQLSALVALALVVAGIGIISRRSG